jgi:hypothetical protein
VNTHCEDEFVYGVIVGELHKAEAFLLSCKAGETTTFTVGRHRFIFSVEDERLRHLKKKNWTEREIRGEQLKKRKS